MAKDMTQTICGIVLEATTDSDKDINDGFWEKDTRPGKKPDYVCSIDTLYQALFDALKFSQVGDRTSYEQVKGMGRNETTTKKGMMSGGSCSMVYLSYFHEEASFGGDMVKLTVYLVDYKLERANEHTLSLVHRQNELLLKEHPLLAKFSQRDLTLQELEEFKQKEGKPLEIIPY